MKQILFYACFLVLSSLSFAQPSWQLKENNNWKFYQYGGLSFNNKKPAADTSAMRLHYPAQVQGLPTTIFATNAASVSDAQGNLLFYSDAYNVWDRNHKLMPNGDSSLLSGNALDAAFIIPVINNPSQYYLFYMSGEIYFWGATGSNPYQLRYSIIDMSLNNGLGDIVAGKKNILVDQNLSGSIKAVPGSNCNVWLITHDIFSPQFKVFEITANGVNTTPITSNVGKGQIGYMGELSFMGNIAISHDGNQLAYAQNGGDLIPLLEMFHFDKVTAILSNPVVIDTLKFILGYSLCFSPDNSKLYLSMLNPGETYANNPYNLHIESSLFQYNLNAGTALEIMKSKLLLSDSIGSYNNVMRMGPDGKIYLPSAYRGDTGTIDGYFYQPDELPFASAPFQGFLGCIQNPDQVGLACSFNRHAIALKSYSSGAESLGGVFVKPIPGDTLLTRKDTAICDNDSASITLKSPSGSYYFEWDNGSSDAQRIVNRTGTYWLRHGDHCHYEVDTFNIVIENISATITVDGFLLSTTVTYASYQWFLNGESIPGATNSSLTVGQNGNYSVVVSSSAGCTDTSEVYEVNNVGISSKLPLAGQINIYPNPVQNMLFVNAPLPLNLKLTSMEGKEIKNIKNANQVSLSDLAKGIYFLHIIEPDGSLIKVEKIIKQ